MAQQGINKATVLGNVGQDPKIHVATNGNKVARISIATGRTWTDEQGQDHKVTQWHNIVAFKGAATYIEKAIKKGSKVYVEGEMQTQNWTDQNGQPRETMQIVVKDIQVVGNGRDNNQQTGGAAHYASQNQQQSAPAQPQQQSAPAQQAQPEPVDDFDDDIPFWGREWPLRAK